jgi:hypothetical protein
MSFAFFLIYLVLTFTRPWELSPALESLPIITVASMVAMGATLVSVLLRGGPTGRAPQAYLTVLFMLWILFSFIVATRWPAGAAAVLGNIQPSFVLFFLAFLNVDTVPRLRATAATLGLVAAFLVAQCALAFHFGYMSGTFLMLENATSSEIAEAAATNASASEAPEGAVVRIRSVGSLNDPNDLAQALATFAGLLGALRIPGRRVLNTLLVWIPIGTIIYGVALTRSRGGLLALLALFFFTFRHHLGKVLSLTLAAAFALGLVAVGFTGGRELSMDESSQGRVEAWYEGMQMLKSAPIWGVGFGNFRERSALVAHNSFVHCFAETGLVGYFLWLWLIALTFMEALALSNGGDQGAEMAELAPWGRALHLALVSFLTAALFLSRTYSPVLFLILGLGTGLSDMARRRGQVADSTPLLRWVPRIVGLEAVSVFMVWLAVRGMG